MPVDFEDDDFAEDFLPPDLGLERAAPLFAAVFAREGAALGGLPPDEPLGEPPRMASSRSPAAATVWPALIAISGALSATFRATRGVCSATTSAAFFTAPGAFAVALLTAEGVLSATFRATEGAVSATFLAMAGAFDAALPKASVALSASFRPRSFMIEPPCSNPRSGSIRCVRKRTLYAP